MFASEKISSEVGASSSDKLFELCERQLLSVIDEAGGSISKITDCTSRIVSDSSNLFESISDFEGCESATSELRGSLEQNVNNIIVNMQFFDELSQRIEHLVKIVGLIKIESRREGFLSDPEISEELLNDVKSIFSIRSEFEVMHQIIPELSETEQENMIELF